MGEAEKKERINLLLTAIDREEDHFKELFPSFFEVGASWYLGKGEEIGWHKIQWPNIWEGDRLKGSSIFQKEGRIGLGRRPLSPYLLDIPTEADKRTSSLHIGDGKHGLSLGNATDDGFLPQIIGVGADFDDAGLYLLGFSGDASASKIPLIIFDGRGPDGGPSKNRPILGITSGIYDKYSLIIDHDGKIGMGKFPEIYRVEVEGEISADDFVCQGFSIRSLIDVIQDQQREIEDLKKKIEEIQKLK